MTTDTHLAPPPRRRTRAKSADTAQLGLFDVEASESGTPALPASVPPNVVARVRAPRRKLASDEKATHLVTVSELPAYPAGLVEIIDRSIADLPPDLIWLTYKEIRKHFGVSRATIARRLKEGVVPGVRLNNGRMLDDGPVRRFDRTQLRWLLLSVRSAIRR